MAVCPSARLSGDASWGPVGGLREFAQLGGSGESLPFACLARGEAGFRWLTPETRCAFSVSAR